MGILNATPDSFFVGSRCSDLKNALSYGIQLWQDGADIIDIGGESTRPQAKPVPLEEEIVRAIPLLKALKEQIKEISLSIDTMKPEVAKKALEVGANLINDVSGFRDPKMRELAAESKADVCLMHMQGTPQTMQLNPFYEKGVVAELCKWFEKNIKLLVQSGVKESQIILDPGIGFGKTVADNWAIIDNLATFKSLGLKLLIGVSRKSFIGKTLNLPPEKLLEATLKVNQIAIDAGVDYIRVHDVKEHKEMLLERKNH